MKEEVRKSGFNPLTLYRPTQLHQAAQDPHQEKLAQSKLAARLPPALRALSNQRGFVASRKLPPIVLVHNIVIHDKPWKRACFHAPARDRH